MVFSSPVGPDLALVDHATSESSPFEGPEKLLEVWFTPSQHSLVDHPTTGTRTTLFSNNHFKPRKLTGLRTISRQTWYDMLDLVKCKVLSVIEGEEVDAYLLSESSMFVWPHKIILKTCGTTTLLLGLPTLLEIARDQCGFPGVWRLFYSRKTYMFPERQIGPHKDWTAETNFLDDYFGGAAAYTVGKTNGDHWFLYLTSRQHTWAPNQLKAPLPDSPARIDLSLTPYLENELPKLWQQYAATLAERDFTLEILMTGLSEEASSQFYPAARDLSEEESAAHGKELAKKLGIDAPSLIGQGATDAYLFSPCGFSANMVGGSDEQRYATIHVTPEMTHSFASFESNVDYSGKKENLDEVISQVVKVFQPRKMSITLFDSHVKPTSGAKSQDSNLLKDHLLPNGYKRVDCIDYGFDGYDLIFLSFEIPDHHHSAA